MPEYLAPGVYVEEISTGPRPIEGVGTSTAGMVGQTERGPERPTLVTGWLEYQRLFGGYIDSSYLSYAVQGFFENGGQRCVIARVVGQGQDGTATRAGGEVGGLNVSAIGISGIDRVCVSLRISNIAGRVVCGGDRARVRPASRQSRCRHRVST